MIFGRKRRAARALEEDVESPEVSGEDLDDLDEDEAESDGAPDEDVASPEDDDEDSDDTDWREDGPFDFDEVDLEADDIARLDLGALIVTPIDGMALELQVEQKTQTVQSALVSFEGAAIEVAVFASPANGGYARGVMDSLVDETRASGGKARVQAGPFGRELFRDVAVTMSGGRKGRHRSRIWFVEGPRWMLRAVLMGSAMDEGSDGAELMEDFFRNLVVRRGSEPKAPGDLIALTMPQDVAG